LKRPKIQLAPVSNSARYLVSVRAIELAGGIGEILDLFGGRLRSFLAPHGYGVVWGGQIIAACADRDVANAPFLIFAIGDYAANDSYAPASLEGLDPATMNRLPWSLPRDDPFAMLEADVRALIAVWPEISAAA